LENQVQVAKMNAQARSVEEAHQNALNVLAKQLKAADDAAKINNDKLRSDAADSGYRVRITETSCVQTAADTGTPSGDKPEPTAQLDPKVGDTLFEIAGTGDEAIRSLNACIAAYDQVRSNQ
jgi:LysM repeat protein